MAEEAKKKEAATGKAADKKDDHGDHAGKAAGGGIGGLLGKMPVMLGGIMILEAAVLFAGFKFLGGGAPRSAAGAELVALEAGHGEETTGEAGTEGAHGESTGSHAATDAHGKPITGAVKKGTVEVPVLEIKAPNKLSGRTFLYDVSIYVSTRGENEATVTASLKAREALIKDRVRTIIAQSDPEKLGGGSEPGLETLRRQVKYQLDEIVGEKMILEVLVPRCIPYRTDY
jgi:flagellar basal body-associated protein FliL